VTTSSGELTKWLLYARVSFILIGRGSSTHFASRTALAVFKYSFLWAIDKRDKVADFNLFEACI